MTDHRLLRLQRIFREIFDDPGLTLTVDYSMKQHSEWDSVATVQIVLATEQEFHFRFSTDAVARVKSVGDLLGALPAQ
jgi:acyl carrier protein